VDGYLFDIEIPMVESGEKKHFEALKLARYEILFVKTQHKPIEGNLKVEEEVDKEADQEDVVNNKASGLAKNEQYQEKSPENAPGHWKANRRNKVMKSIVYESNSGSGETEQDLDFQSNGVAESVTESLQSNKEPADMYILFGKRMASFIRYEAGRRVVPRSDRAGRFHGALGGVKMQSIPKSRRVMAITLFDTPCRVSNKCSRTAGAPKALSGRVTFLPLAGAGMPKTSFRKK
jgi:hypothetical protein